MRTRPATSADIDAIQALAVDTRMFTAEETDFVEETVAGSTDGSLDDHRWIVAEAADGTVLGAAYVAPEPFADRMWNLYFLAVSPAHQGSGIGGVLVGAVESDLRNEGPDRAQVLVVETSSTDQYAPARAAYPRLGFVEEARIRRFYGPGDDKVVFWKDLTTD